MNQIKHQLLIHIDYPPPPGGLEIRYSYPYSAPHTLREQVIRIDRDEIGEEIKEKIEDIVNELASRITAPTFARLPHAEITPKIRHAITTIVIQDQNPDRAPAARMYYLEEIEELQSRIEGQVRMEPGNFCPRQSWERLREKIKGIVWEDYKRLVGVYLFP